MWVIGLTGEKGCGKDTVGEYLVTHWGFERMAFADALKQVCGLVFGLTAEQMSDAIKKENIDERWDASPRQLMQVVGTELFREKLTECFPTMKESIWVDIVKQKILRTEAKRIVLTDVRFENEARLVDNFGGKIVRIQRHFASSPKDTHVSENNLIKEHHLIQNDTSKEDLYQKMEEWVKDWMRVEIQD